MGKGMNPVRVNPNYQVGDKMKGGKSLKPMKKELVFELCIYAISVAFAGFFWRKPAILTISYVVISMMMLTKWHERSDLIFYFVAFGLGPLGEAFAIYLGAWQYSKPFYLIPIWLPFLWGISAVFVKRMSETLLKAKNR
jgi:hypothetical protein